MPDESLSRPSRKGKEREQSGTASTDLVERLIALQRRNAASTRPRERAERPPVASTSREQPTTHTSRPSQERNNATLEKPSPPVRPAVAQMSTPARKAASPRVIASQPPQADPEDFSRRLKISNSPRASPHPEAPHAPAKRLFNPNTDPIPVRRTTEPESSDTQSGSSSHAAPSPPSHNQNHHAMTSPHVREAPAHRQLFDHRKDDPVRFHVLARPGGQGGPPAKSSSARDHVSASSTSSYAHSLASSNFTLSSSTTDGSSQSSAVFDQAQKEGGSGSSGANNAFSVQLKRLYRAISALENKILHEDSDGEGVVDRDDDMGRDGVTTGMGRLTVKSRAQGPNQDEEAEKEKWRKLVADHKDLAEMMHNLFSISLTPSVPASLRNIPQKYNLIIRLWTHAFHRLLENLRRSSWQSVIAFEHLQEFIYYAYTFYTGLLEEHNLLTYRTSWLEALGDLARYRMVVSDMAWKVPYAKGHPQALTFSAVSQVPMTADAQVEPATKSRASISEKPAARIDDSSVPSIGVVAARAMELEPDKERWRGIARQWYATALAERPGDGKLHHHMGLLCREAEGEELRGVYHFVKGMTTLHSFLASRENVLPIWSPAAQSRRLHPDARVPDLFVLLHGMLFTNIQLDDFHKMLDRFLERLDLDGTEEREWIMMAVVNIGSILEYGRLTGVIKKTGVLGLGTAAASQPANPKVRLASKRNEAEGEDKRMDVDENMEDADGDRVMKPAITIQASPALSDASSAAELPLALKYALQLTFAMLSQTLRKPLRKPSPFARSTVNPYITVVSTFLATVLKHEPIQAILERSVPWEDIAAFFTQSVPRGVTTEEERAKWMYLTSGTAPLPEDWCIRGMEWVGRRVFERGFWSKAGDSEERYMEVEVLDKREVFENVTDGIIEDEDGEDVRKERRSEHLQRWTRIVRAGASISKAVSGFGKVDGSRAWSVEGELARKVALWKEEEKLEREQEERRRRGTRWGDDESMDVDEGFGDEEDESEEDENDNEEIRALKARRRYLQNLLQSGQLGVRTPVSRPTRPRAPRKSRISSAPVRPSLRFAPGYTTLVVDTNILLSSLHEFSALVESLRWTVVVPLPVIMELDGLSMSSSPELARAAQAASAYITSHLRSHSTALKVLTSKGNYMTSLTVRTEQVDFDDRASWDRNMDDLILRAAVWQDEHWMDRSAMLKVPPTSGNGQQDASKVVLLSFDRNLRLKARARQLHAANERDLASILAAGT